MTPRDIIREMKQEFRGGGAAKRRPRKYVGGLLPAFAQFLLDLETPGSGYESLEDFFADFPQVTEGVSTLTVMVDGKAKTIRPAYNQFHKLYITDHKRLDFPRSEPYGTGKWADYRHWLDSLVGFSAANLQKVIDLSVEFVLAELPEQAFDADSVIAEPALFRLLLTEFDFGARAKGEPTGAAFQAMVFGFIRADAPHLQVQATKARAGAARTGNIGDIDAWDGDRLVVSVEVKHTTLEEKDVPMFTHFSAQVNERGALGMVVATDFGPGVRDALDAEGLLTLSRSDVADRVAFWDTVKQRIAINAFLFVVVQIEQQSGLIDRVRNFIKSKIENN